MAVAVVDVFRLGGGGGGPPRLAGEGDEGSPIPNPCVAGAGSRSCAPPNEGGGGGGGGGGGADAEGGGAGGLAFLTGRAVSASISATAWGPYASETYWRTKSRLFSITSGVIPRPSKSRNSSFHVLDPSALGATGDRCEASSCGVWENGLALPCEVSVSAGLCAAPCDVGRFTGASLPGRATISQPVFNNTQGKATRG